MFNFIKNLKVVFFSLVLINFTYVNSEEEEIYLKSISDQIQVITKDIKTLEKAVYQKSNISTSVNASSLKSDGLSEDVLTKHLLRAITC